MNKEHKQKARLTRRELLKASMAGTILAASGLTLWDWWTGLPRLHAQTFIGGAESYEADLPSLMLQGFQFLGVNSAEIKNKRILLKPNLVETHTSLSHINTHPLFIRAVAETFLRLGAQKILVAEGPGHRQDTLQILEESGLADVLYEDRIPFLNLNDIQGFQVRNKGRRTNLQSLTLPKVFQEVDWIVSLPKMKTHHWAGVTLSMKNLFGVLPGIYYGWPKNVLHHEGISESILDITATLNPQFTIADGIVGMEGDGPIMGSPVRAGVLVMGYNLPAVDATCARLMGVNPHKIEYLSAASNWLGPIHESHIQQVGDLIVTHQKPFALLDHIPAHRDIRLS